MNEQTGSKKVKKIPIWTLINDTEVIWVRVKQKKRLTELYPQRAILEEERKLSQLGKANNWIDESYYEKLVNNFSDKQKKLVKRYGPKKLPKPDKVVDKTLSLGGKVPEIVDPIFRKIPTK